MKQSRKLLVELLLALGLSVVLAAPAAYAHEGRMDCGRPGMRHERGDFAKPVAMAERRLHRFKEELKITPDQESAWQAFAGKVKTEAEAMERFRHSRPREEPKAWPERMARQVDAMKRRLAGVEDVQAAVQQLYQILTPEQRAIADHHRWGRWERHR